jgi:CelD/BcsL family acetyltransferase involved in cellulose biosynthesis
MAQTICILESQPTARTGAGTAGTLKITRAAAAELAPRVAAAWREILAANDKLANPCFAPEFTQAVAAVRHGVELGVIEQGREVVGIFPFQRTGFGRGVPVGGIVSDYQGLICRPDFTFDPLELLRGCRLVAWDFDRLLASQRCFAPFHKLCEPSVRIDLSAGFDAYAAARRTAGTRQIARCEYMARRLERAFGPVHFVAHSRDTRALAEVLAWKSQQYRASGWKDLFATSWARALVSRLHLIEKQDFAGMLSLLYAGDRLVAGHFGLRSASVWHYWFPAYDRHFARFSPGLILLLKMAEHAPQLGLRTIDLGTGLSLYKKRLMNASVAVAEGSVERPSCLHAARTVRRRIGSWLRRHSAVPLSGI